MRKIALFVFLFAVLLGPIFCNDSGSGPVLVKCPDGYHAVQDADGNISCIKD